MNWYLLNLDDLSLKEGWMGCETEIFPSQLSCVAAALSKLLKGL